MRDTNWGPNCRFQRVSILKWSTWMQKVGATLDRKAFIHRVAGMIRSGCREWFRQIHQLPSAMHLPHRRDDRQGIGIVG